MFIPIDNNLKINQKVYISIRPENIKLYNKYIKEPNILKGKLKEKIFTGPDIKFILTLQCGQDLMVKLPKDYQFKFNKENTIYISWDPECSILFKD